ncbi:MAG: nuclease NucT [Chitinophagaceae bacterium]|nr:nuclease NucT [Chitinophagaceae bacterium]
MDPLSADPVGVTGSANFSEASIKDNDENMMIIRGNLRVADIYLTEFMRLFNHYYFRTVLENLRLAGEAPSDDSLFLSPDDSWQLKYAPGSFKRKRLDLFKTMSGALPGQSITGGKLILRKTRQQKYR